MSTYQRRRLFLQGILLFLIVLLFVHVALSNIPTLYLPTSGLKQMLYICFTLIWNISFSYRIVHPGTRKYLLYLTDTILLWFFIQEAKYNFVDTLPDVVTRYLWYLYYVPILLIPLFGFFAASSMRSFYAGNEKKLLRRNRLLLLPAVLLILLVISNDFHQLVFFFPEGLNHRDGMYRYGIFYYMIFAWVAGLIASSLIPLIRSIWEQLPPHKRFFPFIPSFILLLYVISYNTGHYSLSFKLPEMFSFCFLFTWEICIRIGLIPSNSGYEGIFALSTVPIAITDSAGTVDYSSAAPIPLTQAQLSLPPESEWIDSDTLLSSHSVPGGFTFYLEDFSTLHQLNALLEEQSEKLRDEQELLQAEIEAKEALALTSTQSRIYDNILFMVKPQIQKIQELLSTEDPETFRRSLPWACALNTYIKRRLNLSLLGMQADTLPMQQLTLSLQEAQTYLSLSGIAVDYSLPENTSLSSDQMFILYDSLEAILEIGYPRLDSLLFTLSRKDDLWQARLSMETTNENSEDANEADQQVPPLFSDLSNVRSLFSAIRGNVFLQQEENVYYLTLTFPVHSWDEQQMEGGNV